MKKYILGIDHPAIASRDTNLLADWYCRILDYRVFHKVDGGIHILEAPDGTFLEIMPCDETPRPQRGVFTAGLSHLAIRVSDFQAAQEDLQAKGVVFSAPEGDAAGGGRLRNFPDPEGNVVQIVCRK